MPTTSFAPAAAAPAPPAQPILASTLYSLHLTRRSNAINPIPIDEIGNGESRPPRKRRKLATGFKKLDREVLEGGLEVGEGGVVCLSLPSGREDSGDEFTYTLLASHLLTTSPTSPAFHIDPTGTFSPHRLYSLLCARLRAPKDDEFTHAGGYVYVRTGEGLVGMMRENRQDGVDVGGGGKNEEQGGADGEDGEGEAEGEGETVEEQAKRMMERVRIMRVFDFMGLMEAVGEVRVVLRELESEAPGNDADHVAAAGTAADVKQADADAQMEEGEEEEGPNMSRGGSGHDAGKRSQDDQGTGQRREHSAHGGRAGGERGKYDGKVIADSQASALDIDLLSDVDDNGDKVVDDDLDMLDAPSPLHPPTTLATATATLGPSPAPPEHPPPGPGPGPQFPPPSKLPAAQVLHHPSPSTSTSQAKPTALLILSSLPRLLSPLMHSNHIRGHALLVHLQRSLRHLTTSHDLCVLILNSTVGGGRTSTSTSASASTSTLTNPSHAGQAQAQGQARHNNKQHDEGTSAFSENGNLRPALGKTFAWGLDLSLLVSEVGGGGGGRAGKGARVCEVVSDRFGGRVGRWCVLE